MPRFKKRRKYRGKKRKWRQQKLAVGTVQKIAKEIAKKEDRKNIVKFCHVEYILNPSFETYWKIRPSVIPVLTSWLSMSGTVCYNTVLSPLGGLAQFADMVNPTTLVGQKQAEIEVYGLQVYGMLSNSSTQPVRVECRLVFIPNLNQFTDDTVDYMEPRFTMFHKSGSGCGNLLYRGYNKRALASLDATGIPIKIQTLAKKVIHMKSRVVSGTITGDDTENVTLDTPDQFYRFSLSKYFKKAKKHYIRGDQLLLSNGNYFFVFWNSLPPGESTTRILATSNLQWSLKQPMNSDK